MIQGASALSGLITSGAEDHGVEPLVASELFRWFSSYCDCVLFQPSFVGWFPCNFRLCFVFVGLQDLVARMETSLEKAATSGQRVREYSSRQHLRKYMVGDHQVLSVFVSGASSGVSTRFHCLICRRDVSIQSRGAMDLARLFSSDRHWERDVAYRVQNDMPTYNRQMGLWSCWLISEAST